mmetsp:Transcript_11423/g.19792  ORF Transcript_11423/g.19792 Transcript_11423/m.19792 type:complete len:288 (+) Transcript_11423:133-996(+)
MLAPRKKLWSTPTSAIDIALTFADLHHDDIVYDVGCGDGRVLIQMAAMSLPLPLPSSSTSSSVEAMEGDEEVVVDASSTESSSPISTDVVANVNSDTNIDSANNNKAQHHHCHHFIGIEISPGRAAEARNNIQNAQQQQQIIPPHVTIEIVCANALDTTIVDYSKATVIFLYLVPRGLRLIQPLVWPKKEDVEAEAEEEEEGGEGVVNVSVPSPSSSVTITTTATAATNTMTKTNNNITQQKSQPRRRRRRIITYMSPFENTPHIQKEYCTVEHQEGASWPIYLYHC